MSSKNHKELLKNVAKNKGYRFTNAKIEGSGIFGKILKGVAKAAAPKVLDFIGEKTGQKGITDALKSSSDGVIDAVGDKFMTGGKLKAGTPEMKAHMARLRGMRKVNGGNIFKDIKNGFNRTFNPKLGRKIKKALTSKEAKEIYKGVADIGLTAAGDAAGNPLIGSIGSQLVNGAIDGAGVKRRYKKRNMLVVGGTLVGGVPNVQLNHGARVTRVGGSFRSATGTLYGGSFKSAGGSMMSP
jgi:hypothetical protein